ncbi:glycoside hydrolase [bacterium SCGC AG-212-C10]|nr:glycoside hydrolase [bacterium SCGC AG-212-C10]
MSTLLLVGTKKGLFILESDDARSSWEMRGPYCEFWPINDVNWDPAQKAIVAGGGSEWFGPAVWKSTDRGATWTHSSEGIRFAEGEAPITSVWNVTAGHGSLYAGTDPAGLFRSDDGGETWAQIPALRQHPTTALWNPGGAGLILHTIIPHENDAKQLWIAISAAGTYYTADGGETWEPRNRDIRLDFEPEMARSTAEAGHCVHSIAATPGHPDALFQQNHLGMYYSADKGVTWKNVSEGLPTDFGFASAAHPHQAGTYYTVPLTDPMSGRFMPEGKAAVWRTRDCGANWEKLTNGLPQHDAFTNVLRGAMSADTHPSAGIYFGTGGGQLFGSADAGDSWRLIQGALPPIYAVQAVVVD